MCVIVIFVTQIILVKGDVEVFEDRKNKLTWNFNFSIKYLPELFSAISASDGVAKP